MVYLTLPICFLAIGAALCSPETVQNDQSAHEGPDQESEEHETRELQDHIDRLEKRSPHYDFGLGKRAYSYVSEYKRLPVYNFGLGKRSRPYSFGLGKRSVDDDGLDDSSNENYSEADALVDLIGQYDDADGLAKRARPYSFGLGKRSGGDVDDITEQKRAKAYNFGLGKRTQLLYNFGLGKRTRTYGFGLGKRLSKFNFGLGKRVRDMHRFNFGLGKRSPNSPNDYSYDGDSNMELES